MVITLEGFGGKTGNLPLHEPGGGSALRVWRWGARTFPNADADSGELFGLPSFVLLHHVQSLPHSFGGSADARGWDFGRGVVETAGGDSF